ncbi:protein disulfide isomerase (PDI) protein, partial [Quaeritorhiza haematococci]
MFGLPTLLLASLALASAYLPTANALYSSRDAVLSLNPNTWKSEVLDTEHVVVAEFYAPWCGHCKHFAPEYKKAAEKLKGLVKVVAVDCDSHRQLCGQYGIQGFPTVKVFQPNKKGSPLDYQGPRTAAALVDFAVPKIASHVVLVGSKGKAVSYEEFIAQEPSLPHVILASKKSATPALYKALSVEYKNRMVLGEIRSSEKETLSKLDASEFPSVYVIPKGEETPVKYDGAMKHAALTKFFDKYAEPAKKKKVGKEEKKVKEEKKEKKEEKKAKKEKFDPTIPQVTTQSDLQTHCLSKHTLCIIAFIPLEPEFPESVTAHNASLTLLSSLKQKYYLGDDFEPLFNILAVNPIEHGKKLMKDFD